jgi:hypothetical protein
MPAERPAAVTLEALFIHGDQSDIRSRRFGATQLKAQVEELAFQPLRQRTVTADHEKASHGRGQQR